MNKFAFLRNFLLLFAIFIFFADCGLKNKPKLLFSLPSLSQNSPSDYGVNVSVTELVLSEGGVSSSFTLSLSNAPSSDVTIQCSTDAQLAYTNLPVTFTQSNYLTPQTITVNAVDDLIKQGNRTTTINFTVNSSDLNYNSVIVTPIAVQIADNDTVSITAFSFASPAVTGTITGNTITVSVPNGTNVNALVPTITITGASVSPASGVAQNFTSPVTYTVTAADGSTATYTVTVSDQTAKDLTSFRFANVPAMGTFTSATTIGVIVPFGTNVTALVATFTTTGVGVNIAGTSQVSGTTINNFSTPKTYTVVAADASTKNYTVTVTISANNTNSILDFSFANPAVRGSISGTSIAITVPFGTNVTALVPTISINGASVSPVSGVARNFSIPVIYTVTAGNSSTQMFTVTVTVAASASSAIVNGSFQSGTVINVSTNSTAILSTPVNLSKAFVYCGAKITGSAARNMITCQLSSPTTVNIQAGNATSGTTVNWFVVEYAFGVTVQRGSIALAAGGATVNLTQNIPILAVNQSKAFALVYSRTNYASFDKDEERTVVATLSNPTTLNITRQTGGGLNIDVEWQVVEFSSGGANVQYGPSTIGIGSGSTTATLGINSVTSSPVNLSKTFLFFSYNGSAGIGGIEADLYTRGIITNPTTITFTRRGTANSVNISWFAIEMMDGTSVQSGSTTLTSNGSKTFVTTTTGDLTSVNTSKSMLVWSYDTQSGGTANMTQDSATYSGKFNSPTELQFDRNNDEGNDATIDWSVVTFQ